MYFDTSVNDLDLKVTGLWEAGTYAIKSVVKVVKWHEVAWTFTVVIDVREITAKECNYGEYGLVEHVPFLDFCFVLFCFIFYVDFMAMTSSANLSLLVVYGNRDRQTDSHKVVCVHGMSVNNCLCLVFCRFSPLGLRVWLVQLSVFGILQVFSTRPTCLA